MSATELGSDLVPGSAAGVSAAAVGLGFAAAGVVLAAGAAVARRATLSRRLLDPIDALETGVPHPFDDLPARQVWVTSETGNRLYVEIDEPAGGDRGPTVVFSHGFCLSSKSWVLQRRALVAAGVRCVAWDQRGHGRSDQAPEGTYSLEHCGRDLGAVIEGTAPSGDLVLAGHSMGAMTMMALAEANPALIRDRVIGAAFVATSAGGVGLHGRGMPRRLSAAAVRLAPLVLANLAGQKRVWQRVRTAARDVESAVIERFSFDSEVSEETVRFAADMLTGTDLAVVGAFVQTLDAHSRIATLAAFDRADVLVLNGEADRLTPPEHSAMLVAALPHSEHVVIRDAGHLVMLEHPTVVSAQFLALIERAVAARALSGTATHGRLRRMVTDVARRRRVAAVAQKAQKAPAR